MIPVVTPEEMNAIDSRAPEPVEVLIGRAGAAVARVAVDMLGGTYGRRVVVLAGKGNNGNDGREAARRLRRRGVRVHEIDVASAPATLSAVDLVIDAAFGTGFRGSYRAPDVGGTSVLAVDIPSGIDGLTGEPAERVLAADRTVTFAAFKPGLLLEPGARLAGAVDLVDIGLDVSSTRSHLVQAHDLTSWLPRRDADTNKWRSAVNVIGGSPGLEGAATLTSLGALRGGAGYVRWSSPGGVPQAVKPLEVVGVDLPSQGWAPQVLDGHERFRALVVGNGLGLDGAHAADVGAVVRESEIPVVVDADAITLLAGTAARCARPTTIFTPHDREFARLAGGPPGPDRLTAVRDLASRLGSIVLLKGPLTIVAEPGGRTLLSNAGDARLATLGSGDVLAGVIAALVAGGLEPFTAAAAAAYVHGRAGDLGWRRGMVAGDLLEHLPRALDILGRD